MDQREFCMLDAHGNPEMPLASPRFLIRKLPEPLVRNRPNVYDQWGNRIGPNASGEVTNHLIQP